VIILTGPPAAGKTTVAELLATRTSIPTVRLTTDAAFAQLGDLEDHAIDTGDLDAEQTTAEVRRVLASGRYRLR
jgi:broad-specificity NMP kinase